MFHQLPPDKKQAALNYIEFLIYKYGTQKKHPKAGTMKGIVTYIAKDFDAPLEDFKDYM